MASLINIPNELLVEILSCLKALDLANISLVCHHLRTLAEPFLYHAVQLNVQPRWPRSRNHAFLLTVLNRPLLATCVHELTLQWFFPPDYEQSLVEHPEVAKELVRFQAAAERVGQSHSPVSHGPQIILLLHLLPRLRALTLRCRFPYSLFSTILEDQAMLPRPPLPVALQSLQEFTCSCIHKYSGCSPLMILGLFALPSIRMLDICMVSEMQIDDDDNDDDDAEMDLSSPAFAGTSSVTDLRFSRGEVSSWSLLRILPLPRALTRFSLGECSTRGRSGFDIAELRRALVGVRNTLERLAVCFHDDDFSDGARDMAIETIGSLREWPVLAELRCPLSLLVGGSACETGIALRLVDVVPRVVREVRVASDEFWSDDETVGMLREMVELKSVCGLRRLAVVSVEPRWGVEEEMRVVCEAASVALVVVG